MARGSFWLRFALASALVAASAMPATSQAQETKKISKGSGKYEEHYEILPPEGDPDTSPAPGAGNLDPEGGAPAPSPQSNRGAATAPSHKSPFVAAPVAPRKTAAPEQAPAQTAYPEPEKVEKAPPPARDTFPRNVKRVDPSLPVEQVEEKKRPKPAVAAADDAETAEVPGLAFFYDAVNEGGEWINHPRYGRVFAPKVDDDWRPYTVGRWAYADELGWVWISDEPFGWATYHYGRWSLDTDKGWVWIPALEWAPSWVVWRQGEDAIGWAPLPPSAQFTKKGLSIDANAIESSRYEDAWVFVDPRYFGQPGMRRYLRSTRWNADLVPRTAARVGYQRDGASIANRGLAPEDIEKLSGRPIQRVKIKLADETRLRRSASVSSNGDIRLYRPDGSRMEDIARKLAKKRPREDGEDADRTATAARTPSEGEEKPRKPAAPKTVTKFAPQPVLQRVETESGVTESWVTPQTQAATEASAKADDEKPAAKTADGKHEGKKDIKFAPAKSERTETEGSVTESWVSPPQPAHEHSAKETGKTVSKATNAKPATGRTDPTIERGQGSRYESYTVLSPQETGEAPAGETPAGEAAPKKSSSMQAPAGEGVQTGSTAKQKRRWDGSGASGAPGATIPGAVE